MSVRTNGEEHLLNRGRRSAENTNIISILYAQYEYYTSTQIDWSPLSCPLPVVESSHEGERANEMVVESSNSLWLKRLKLLLIVFSGFSFAEGL